MASQTTSPFDKFLVPLMFILFVLVRAADNVFRKRVQNAMGSEYTTMCFSFIWPLAAQVMTACLVAGYIFLKRKQGHREFDWRFFLPRSPLACAAGTVPLYLLALMNLGGQLNASLSSLPAPFVSMTMQSLMCNTTIVWMMVLSFLWVGTRYKPVHFAGAVLALLSVLVGLWSKLAYADCSQRGMERGDCLNSYKNNAGEWEKLDSGSMTFWYGFFFVSLIPAAVSSVFNQKVLQEHDVDIIFAKWWAGNFQIIWGWLCVWIIWVPTPAHETSPGQTFTALLDTLHCLFGGVPHPGDESCAEGSMPAGFWFTIYLVFNCAFSMCLLWLTKRMSAVWIQIANVLCLDLTNIFSQWQFLAGGGAAAMSLDDWIGTVLASAALGIYCLAPEKKAIAKKADEKLQGLNARAVLMTPEKERGIEDPEKNGA